MITAVQQSYVEEHAYLPEHIVPYVTSVSQAEPFLLEDFLAYARKDHLIFVGYPLKEPFEEKRMKKVLDQAIRRFKPKEIALTAPSISSSIAGKTCSPLRPLLQAEPFHPVGSAKNKEHDPARHAGPEGSKGANLW